MDPGADAHPVVCEASPGASANPLMGGVGCQGLWLQDPWFPGVGVSLLVGGSMPQYLTADPRWFQGCCLCTALWGWVLDPLVNRAGS